CITAGTVSTSSLVSGEEREAVRLVDGGAVLWWLASANIWSLSYQGPCVKKKTEWRAFMQFLDTIPPDYLIPYIFIILI
ncbi:hypothetical protein PanWU01x14_124110, partial [Parasponia andersonii]